MIILELVVGVSTVVMLEDFRIDLSSLSFCTDLSIKYWCELSFLLLRCVHELSFPVSEPSHVFTVNDHFTSKLFRVKIQTGLYKKQGKTGLYKKQHNVKRVKSYLQGSLMINNFIDF